MKITVAKTAGFCMGVQRAVHLAVESSSSDQEKVYTIGPLIHNRQALELLESRGIRELTADNEDTNKPGQVLIRAHGIPPEQEKEYRDKGHTIVDGTCPRVKTVHRVIEKYREEDYTILICGDHGHAEVEGLMGYAGDKGIIVNTPEDIDNLDKDNTERVCLVSQTTFSIEGFEEIAERLRNRFPEKEVRIKKTICAATKQRQEEVTRLSNKVDTMIVVGGKNSANTKRLAELAADTGIPVQHIETEKDIDSSKFKRDTRIGVTAGASTPEWMINRTVEYLQQIDRKSRASIKGFFSNSVETMSALNIPFAAAGAAFFSASSILQKMEVNTLGLIITFLYLIAVYLWNSLTNLEMTKHHGVRRYTLYSRHKKGLFAFSGTSLILLLGLSYLEDLVVFYTMLVPVFAGIMYHFTIFPGFLRKIIPYSNLKNIPSSKDLFAALALSILTTFLPQVINRSFSIAPEIIIFFLGVFLLAYIRALIFDLKDIEGDRIMGRETLVTIIGEKRVKSWIDIMVKIITVCILASSLLIYTIDSNTRLSIYLISQIPVLLYIYLFMKKIDAFTKRPRPEFYIFVDLHFYISAFCLLSVEHLLK